MVKGKRVPSSTFRHSGKGPNLDVTTSRPGEVPAFAGMTSREAVPSSPIP